jgi:hypothetical protein
MAGVTRVMNAIRISALFSVLCAVAGTATAQIAAPEAVPEFSAANPQATIPVSVPGAEASVTARSPENPVFYDRPLMLRQYGYGVLAGSLAGAVGFYIGNAFEGAIFGGDSHKGYLSFTGIRYRHKRGPFWGGGAGLLFGSSLTVFFIGDADEEPGSVLMTVAGGALTTAAAVMLADAIGVQKERGMLAFVPLIALPPIGAVGGYHVSRWFNDRKRRSITESGESSASGPALHAPRFGFVPGVGGEAGWRLDALNLTF